MLNTISLNQQYNLSFYEDIFKNFKCLNCGSDLDEIETFTIIGRIETFRNTELLYFFKNLKDDYLSKLKRIEFKHQDCNYSLQLLINYNNFTIKGIKSSLSFYKDKSYITLLSSSTKDNLVENEFYFRNNSKDNKFTHSDFFFNKEQAIKYLDNLIFI